MPPISFHSLESAPAASQPSLQRLVRATGRLPNMFAVLANSPAALNAYLQLAHGLTQGRFDAAERERIALAVSAANGCEYCLAAHGWLARQAGVAQNAIALACAAAEEDPLAYLAAEMVRQRGRPSEDSLRRSGLDDEQRVELVAQVALMTLSNYLNNLAQPEIDFPPPLPA